jgi:hypothetical protein
MHSRTTGPTVSPSELRSTLTNAVVPLPMPLPMPHPNFNDQVSALKPHRPHRLCRQLLPKATVLISYEIHHKSLATGALHRTSTDAIHASLLLEPRGHKKHPSGRERDSVRRSGAFGAGTVG